MLTGAPEKDDEGNVIEDKFSEMPVVMQYLKRMFSQLDYYNRVSTRFMSYTGCLQIMKMSLLLLNEKGRE